MNFFRDFGFIFFRVGYARGGVGLEGGFIGVLFNVRGERTFGIFKREKDRDPAVASDVLVEFTYQVYAYNRDNGVGPQVITGRGYRTLAGRANDASGACIVLFRFGAVLSGFRGCT